MSNTSHRLSGGWHQPYHQYWQRLSLHYLHYLLLTQPFQPPVRAQSPDTNTLTSILAKATELARVKQLDAHSGACGSTPTLIRTQARPQQRARQYPGPTHSNSIYRTAIAQRTTPHYLALCHMVVRAVLRAAAPVHIMRSLALWQRHPVTAAASSSQRTLRYGPYLQHAALPPLRRAACARHVPAPPTLAAQVD